MINATPVPVCASAVSELYNVTIICTIHPDSTADQCVVMAMADGIMTRAGEICTQNVLCIDIRMYVL